MDHGALLSEAGCGSARDVVCSSFVIMQLLINVIGSFVGPVGTFYLLFDYLSQGPYAWYSGPVIGVILGSPFGTAILTLALAPAGMPEALRWGKFKRLDRRAALRLARIFPFCGSHPLWRVAIMRHMMLGLQTGLLYWPPALLIARFALGPELSTWEQAGPASLPRSCLHIATPARPAQILGGATYISLLAVPIVPLGLLGFAVEYAP